MPTIKDALDLIGKLTSAEQESLKTMLLSPAFAKALDIEDFITQERFTNGRVCPLCGCVHVICNGHRKDGTQRYVCKDCGRSFVIATNSIVSGTKKDLSAWEKYIDCMMNGLSLRKTASACGIHTKKVSRIIATAMLILAVAFLGYALNHPEGAFPWSNTVTFILYGVYVAVMVILFIAPFKKK
jgi:transposase-like protein